MGKTWTVSFVAVILLMAVALPYAPLARADDRICDNETLSSGTFDNVIVKAGSDCTLNTGVTVLGNVEADGADDVFILGSGSLIPIGGDVLITGSTGKTDIQKADVSGNIKIEEQKPLFIRVNDNVIGGNIEVEKNEVKWIQVNDNDFTSGNIKVEENTATADIGGSGIEVNGNGVSDGNPQNIEVKENEVEDGDMLVNGNEVSGNIEVQGNMVKQNIEVNDNEFFSGNLKVEENETEDGDIFIGGNGPSSNSPENIEVKENKANEIVDVSSNIADEKIEVKENKADGVDVSSNTAGEEIEVEDNTATTGDVACSSNTPAPVGSGNTASGSLTGQCSGL